MLLPRKNVRLQQDVDKIVSCECRGAVPAHQVDREQLGLGRQGDTCSSIIEEVESLIRICGVDGISRYTCCGVMGKRQLTKNPISRGRGDKMRYERVLKRVQLSWSSKTACCMTGGGTTHAHTAREHVDSFSTLSRMRVVVRKRADLLKPPQERGLLGLSHADEAAPTSSIRSNTSRRMKGASTEERHTYVRRNGVPLRFTFSVVKETSSSVTVPPTRQGPCSGSARPEAPSEAIAKTSGLWLAGVPEHRPKSPKKGLGERRLRSSSATAERTRIMDFSIPGGAA